ncbi:hypothetical protein H4F47_15350 [Pectobacterium brasiliense]|uniref:hypothetical protein n=1 Tax=Pectobacterium brasiliense TaxID=180957 RepID=UPI001968EBE8|nr:hypothetical protein [Pectobacterium brasiliense]MBN3044287.1 hypothetical protein [Pectobacterium brasiliense]MBN3102311.1 hypothetical protein [Pectobacterium brasiliense]
MKLDTGLTNSHKKTSGTFLNVACDGPQGGGQEARHKKSALKRADSSDTSNNQR